VCSREKFFAHTRIRTPTVQPITPSLYKLSYPGSFTFELIKLHTDLREVGWDGRDWIDLAQDRDQWRAYVNVVMNLRVP
jgi:hypothetical protein